jgi:hypothetical protein
VLDGCGGGRIGLALAPEDIVVVDGVRLVRRLAVVVRGVDRGKRRRFGFGNEGLEGGQRVRLDGHERP